MIRLWNFVLGTPVTANNSQTFLSTFRQRLQLQYPFSQVSTRHPHKCDPQLAKNMKNSPVLDIWQLLTWFVGYLYVAKTLGVASTGVCNWVCKKPKGEGCCICDLHGKAGCTCTHRATLAKHTGQLLLYYTLELFIDNLHVASTISLIHIQNYLHSFCDSVDVWPFKWPVGTSKQSYH